jgi:hypothetical protein
MWDKRALQVVMHSGAFLMAWHNTAPSCYSYSCITTNQFSPNNPDYFSRTFWVVILILFPQQSLSAIPRGLCRAWNKRNTREDGEQSPSVAELPTGFCLWRMTGLKNRPWHNLRLARETSTWRSWWGKCSNLSSPMRTREHFWIKETSHFALIERKADVPWNTLFWGTRGKVVLRREPNRKNRRKFFLIL